VKARGAGAREVLREALRLAGAWAGRISVYELDDTHLVTLTQRWRQGWAHRLPAAFDLFSQCRQQAIGSGEMVAVAQDHASAYVALPLQSQGQVLGLLELIGPDLQRLSSSLPRLCPIISLLEKAISLHRLQKEIAHRQQGAEALRAVAEEILLLPDRQEILQSVAMRARALLGADTAALCLLEPAEGKWKLGAFYGLTSAFPPIRGRQAEASMVEPGHCTTCCPFLRPQSLSTHVSSPLPVQGRQIGALCIGYRKPRLLHPWQQNLLDGLAAQTAVAIEHLSLHQRVRELARWEERDRIGKDLHDGIIQSLYAIGLSLEGCAGGLEEEPEAVRQRMEEVVDHLNEVIADIRSYIFDLQPHALRGRTLAQTLLNLAREYQAGRPLAIHVAVEPRLDGAIAPWPTQHLFHIAQEALSNAVKYSAASSISLRLSRSSHTLVLQVQDNGQGFDPEEVQGGQGLRNMADRAQALGGSLEVRSERDQGTTITLEAPLKAVVRRKV